MSEPLIEATELCVRRHGGLVLDNVSLTLGATSSPSSAPMVQASRCCCAIF
ncbi:hypothetical protein N9Y94_02905 [Alphaproteobacteria bacterium]|nr:hypothetical protein [Alphaproteobacteria bacterium]